MQGLVTFWGVRGSIPCPSRRHVRFGGNTSCVQVTLGGHHLILDAGTGLRDLGEHPDNRSVRHFSLLMTHTHWDHILGFPFFGPAYNPEVVLDVYAGHLAGNGGIQNLLANQMSDPMFPVPLETLRSRKTFTDFQAGESFTLGDEVRIRTAPLNHPNGATGYRISWNGHSICYVTDTEHVPGKPDQTVLSLIDGADIVIYDSTYTDAEFPAKVGWGHSTWQEGVRLCQEAKVGQLVIFHHDPAHTDDFMDVLEQDAQAMWGGCRVARDGMILSLP